MLTRHEILVDGESLQVGDKMLTLLPLGLCFFTEWVLVNTIVTLFWSPL